MISLFIYALQNMLRMSNASTLVPHTFLRAKLLWLRVRPGVRRFLAQMSEMFGDRLFVYTHASLAYARRIMSVLDPRKSFFGDRVLATDLGKRLQENPLSDLVAIVGKGAGKLNGSFGNTLKCMNA